MNITNYDDNIFTIQHFLTDSECISYINLINNTTNICPFTNSGIFKNNKFTDSNISNSLYKRLCDFISVDRLLKINIIGNNDLIMTGQYEPEQEFSLHTDTGLYYDKINKLKSTYTLLIYLNDDFEGGETTFYDQSFNEQFKITPQKGMALIFNIDNWHRGCKIKKGNKLWIGCELIGKITF